jgi:hypothetical protein
MPGAAPDHNQSASALAPFGAAHHQRTTCADSDLNRRMVVGGKVAERARDHQPTRP